MILHTSSHGAPGARDPFHNSKHLKVKAPHTDVIRVEVSKVKPTLLKGPCPWYFVVIEAHRSLWSLFIYLILNRDYITTFLNEPYLWYLIEGKTHKSFLA